MKAYILILVTLGIASCGKGDEQGALKKLQTGSWCHDDSRDGTALSSCFVFEADGTWKSIYYGPGDKVFTIDMPENTYSISDNKAVLKSLYTCSPTYPQADLSKCTFSEIACTPVDETHLDCGVVREQRL